jgi:hypothetical protein
MTNIRLIAYTSLAVGLINWRYIDFSAGGFAIIVGALILIATLIKPIQSKIVKGPGFLLTFALSAVAIIYSFLA